MEKKCIKCSKVIPEEAAFCLYCFTEQEAGLNTAPLVYGTAAPVKKMSKKAIAGIVLCAFVFLFLLGGCIAAMKKNNSTSQLATDTPVTETQVVTYTQTVDVTDASGEQVTDASGEAVTNVITVTQIHTYVPVPVQTTEEKGFFDKLFDNGKETTANNTSAGDNNPQTVPETTEKQGFFDKLFGKDETTTTTKAPAPFADVVTTQKGNNTSTTKNNASTVQPATTQKTVTTQKPATTQAPTTQKPTTTAKPTTTQKPTTTAAPVTTQSTTEQSSYYFEYAPYDPKNPDGKIKLTKYVGNASVVHIPTHINGKRVYSVEESCFENNYQLREIHVDYASNRNSFYFSRFSLKNCPNLTKINCTESLSLNISPSFSVGCPITEMIFKNHRERFIDGAYYYGGASLLWYTCHPDYTTLTLPPQCTKIDNGHNLNEVPNLRVLNIHKNVSNIPHSYLGYSDGLEQVNVEPGNPWAYSVNGIMFCRYSQSHQFDECIYPRQNKTKTLVMPRTDLKCTLGFSRSSVQITNDNLEELWLNESSLIYAPDSSWMYTTAYPNLKRIYITPNHPQYALIAKTFTGELIVKDF